MKIVNRELTLEKDGIAGYLAHPDRKEAGPGMLILQHHFGVTGHMKATVCEYAKLGYATFIPDIYSLLGIADGVHQAQKVTSDGQFLEVINRGWRYLTGRNDVDGRRCAVVGYCMGGRLGIHFAAATPSVRALVGYYPSVRDRPPDKLQPRHPNDDARDVKCPSITFFGGQDRVAPRSMQEGLWSGLQASGQPVEWHFFPHVGHGFALADGESYDPRVAELAWKIAANFLERELNDEQA